MKGLSCTGLAALAFTSLVFNLGYAAASEVAQPRSVTVGTLTNRSEEPVSNSFEVIRKKAEAGDVNAQISLAQMYDSGKGVKESSTEAFKWWLRAAEQGVGTAQHNVGVAYLSGVGAPRNKEKALQWFTKAADQGHVRAREYAERLGEGKDAVPVVVAGVGLQASRPRAPARPVRYGAKEEICQQVVANFIATHKYVPDSFVCVEFAAGVWWELMRKGINARVRVGSRSLGSIHDANHAWVMAEMTQGNWVAIEPQHGVVYPQPNSFYYSGYDFTGDAEVREHNQCVKALLEASKRYQTEVKIRDDYAARYNNGDWGTKATVLPSLRQQEQHVAIRLEELRKEERRLSELLEKAKPAQ